MNLEEMCALRSIMKQISTKGDDTIAMAKCLAFVNACINRAVNTPEDTSVEKNDDRREGEEKDV
jgi:hypothetical protein